MTHAPVTRVVVMEDRAQVTRSGTVELPSGSSKLVITGVSPIISDKTLSAECSGAVIADISVKRAHVLVKKPTGLGLELDELELELKLQKEHTAQLRSELASSRDIAGFTLHDAAQDASWGALESDWVADYRMISAAREEQLQELLKEEALLAELQAKRERLSEQVAATQVPELELRASIELSLESESGGVAELKVSYVVPSACWRPKHSARLTLSTVELATSGCVWQNTGESWDKVQLIFSTERPSLGSEAPKLTDDRLYLQQKMADVIHTREQVIDSSAVVEEGGLPGIDDGGEQQLIEAKELVTVPSDGRPYVALIQEVSCPCEPELIAYPELALAALLKADLINTGTKPILAGPVDLIGYTGAAGRGELGFVSPGEHFSVGFGPEPKLRLRRELKHKDKTSKISLWNKDRVTAEIFISNIGSEEITLKITERIPVSEVEQARVELDEEHTSSGYIGPDKDGFVTWTKAVPAGGARKLTLRYMLMTKKSSSEV